LTKQKKKKTKQNMRPNGVRFVASPTTTALTWKWQLKPGDIVTFKHRGFWSATQKPKSPTIFRVRTDKTWDEVVATANLKQTIKGMNTLCFHY
jgi:hypothetical protein